MRLMHSTQTKKSYRKPVLLKKGSVAKITKATKTGSEEDGALNNYAS